MMDWFGHAGAPYYFLKRTYEPTHVAIGLSRLLWAAGEKIALPVKVSNAGGALAGGKISVSVYDDGFRQVYQRVLPVSLRKGASVTAVDAGSFAVPVGYSDRFLFILAELRDGAGRLVSRSWYNPRVLKLMSSDKIFYDKYVSEPMAWPTLDKGPWLKPSVGKTRTSLAIVKLESSDSLVQCTIRNTGKLPAFMTQVDILDVKRAFFASDNFFWLAPGESKNVTIHVIWRDESHRARLQVGAWNASPVNKSIEP
jgi:beta-mannosidase